MTTAIRELTSKEKMTRLCESFPALRGVPGTSPWNQHTFAKWASGPAPSPAMRITASFILAVWNGGTPEDGGWWNEAPYAVGRFDAVDAIGHWDHQHIRAYVEWCVRPFWP